MTFIYENSSIPAVTYKPIYLNTQPNLWFLLFVFNPEYFQGLFKNVLPPLSGGSPHPYIFISRAPGTSLNISNSN